MMAMMIRSSSSNDMGYLTDNTQLSPDISFALNLSLSRNGQYFPDLHLEEGVRVGGPDDACCIGTRVRARDRNHFDFAAWDRPIVCRHNRDLDAHLHPLPEERPKRLRNGFYLGGAA